MKLKITVEPHRKPNQLVEIIFRAVGSFNEGKYPAFPADIRITCDQYAKDHNEVIGVVEDASTGDITIFDNSFPVLTLRFRQIVGEFPTTPNAKIKEL